MNNHQRSPSDTSSAPADEDGQAAASYREAGVDIDLAQGLLTQVKGKLSQATRPEVLAPIGGFGGLFQIDPEKKYHDPVMVVSIDGVGTKLMVAAMMNRYDGVGHDIVNHCVNDVAVQGAEPLYFLDYLGIGRLRSPLYEQVLGSLAEACAAQNVALLGGETAEMPGMYGEDFDLVGCITGVVERSRVITGAAIRPGDLIIGLAASGLHTNGYSLAREVLFKRAGLTVDAIPDGLGESVGEALLKPHVCYWPAIRRALAKEVPLHGMAHITGGGWIDNIKRVLPAGTAAECRLGALPVPPIMRLIQQLGRVETAEMYRAFNMGMGMVWIIPQAAEKAAMECCRQAGLEAAVAGRIVAGEQNTVTLIE